MKNRKIITLCGVVFLAASNLTYSNSLSVSITPSGDQFKEKDDTVSFSCSATGGCPPYTYSWTFSNGQPATSQQEAPGAVTYGASADGKVNKAEITGTDAEGSTDSAEIDVNVIKVTAVSPGNTVESEDSGKFTSTVEPNSLTPSAYLWEASWPANVGNAPAVSFKDPDKDETIVEDTRWFANPDSRWRVETPATSTYKVSIKATVGGSDFTSPEVDLPVSVNDSGNMTPWPLYTGMNTVVITKNATDNKWYVTGQGQFQRAANLGTNVNCPATSQFHPQVLAHENRHVEQFTNIAPWKDFWNVNDFYTNTLSQLPGQATEQAQRTAVNTAINTWLTADNAAYVAKICDMEWDACQNGNNATAPDYRDFRKNDVPTTWGCTF